MENRKVKFDSHTNLLQLEEHMYPLVDVKTPNVFHNLFPYEEVPKIAFNDRIVPHHMPDEIWITDTTFRDGQQSRAPYTTEQIVRIYDYMHRLGGPKGKIRQCEFFLYSKKDRDAVYKCLEQGYEFPEITSWIRASKKDFELVRDMGLKETGILVSCSDYHIFYKMRMTRKEAMEHYLSVVRECLEIGVSPRCHLEDITRADIYGYVIPFCLELMKLSKEYQIPIKVRCCDTMGYGVNYAGAVIPRSVQGIIYGLMVHAGVPSEMIEWHGHNDFYKAVSNSTTAWLYGASGVNCSLFGIGERTGNTPLEAMVFEYAQLRGTLDGMDTTVITEMADYYEKEYYMMKNIRNAITYPVMMVGMLLIVLFVLFTRVMPVFEQVYAQLGVQMSPLSRAASRLGGILSGAALVVFVLLAVAVLIAAIAAGAGKELTIAHKLMERLKRNSKTALAAAGRRFTAVLALTIRSGMELDKGMELARELVDNGTVAEKIDICSEKLQLGEGYYEAMKESGLFSSFHIQLIKVGVRSGKMDEVLQEISDDYEQQADASIDAMVARLEPTLVAVLAVAVGLILLSVMLPLAGILAGVG